MGKKSSSVTQICERSLAGVLELYRQSMALIQIGGTVNFNKVQMQYSCYEGENYPQRPTIFLYKAVKVSVTTCLKWTL